MVLKSSNVCHTEIINHLLIINMKIKLLITLLAIISCQITVAQDRMKDSRAYIDAYFTEDIETCRKYLHDSVTWQDPTFTEINAKNEKVVGKEEMLAHLQAMGEEITDLGFDIEQHYISANIAVFEGWMKYSWTDTSIDKKYDFKLREVTILEYKDGKVFKHTDYGDFKAWRKQYKAQMPASEEG